MSRGTGIVESKKTQFIAIVMTFLLVALLLPVSASAIEEETLDTADILDSPPAWLSEAATPTAVDLQEAIEASGIDLATFENYEAEPETDLETLGADEPLVTNDLDLATLGETNANETEIQPFAAPSWKRLSGSTRYDTMSSIVKEAYPTAPSSQIAILATGDSFPDALAASSLAGAIDSPIILTGKTKLSAQAEKQITASGIKHVLIIGGTSAVSTNVEKKLIKKLGKDNVRRCFGSDRFDTAYKIYQLGAKLNIWGKVAFVATGNNFPDALSIGPITARTGSPIFLYDTTNSKLSTAQLKALKSGKFEKIILVGGTGALPDSIRKSLGTMGSKSKCGRLSGSDRYQTSLSIAEFGIQNKVLGTNGISTSYAAVATGTNFPDALSGAALCGRLGAPLYLVDDSPAGRVGLYRSLARSVYHGTLKKAYVLGGEGAVPAAIVSKGKGMGSATSQEKEVITLINKERAKAGLPALKMMPILQGTCDIRADELTMRYAADHTRPYRVSGNFLECFTALTYDLSGLGVYPFTGLGENIAYGFRTPAAVMDGWMNSPGHRSNILNSNWKYIGVGKMTGANGVPYWVQFFGC